MKISLRLNTCSPLKMFTVYRVTVIRDTKSIGVKKRKYLSDIGTVLLGNRCSSKEFTLKNEIYIKRTCKRKEQ